MRLQTGAAGAGRSVRGVVLPMALCFLLLLALMAAGAARNSTLEYRLSGNGQQQEALRQMAVGATRALAAQPQGFSSGLALGERRCAALGLCDQAVLQLPATVALPDRPESLHYHIERTGPVAGALILRAPEADAFSVGRFDFERFEALVELDERDARGGAAVVAVGIARRRGLAN
ncbi:hypothetical protein FV139_16665 [Parahaliea maris]|uniref:Type 4 fimbrial biogenesis protein PilX N-terminal domain-containing protein n=1 Tax=Parahaliea maris TaxID=2716870 RepID=A0A5C8ZU78_9GAMM|nr:hypothetical protein [Parahaliea maris]TXS91359.1 hypothetical protein FV139_16665 [Parahaliea maris]